MRIKILIQGPLHKNTPIIYHDYKNKGYEVLVSSYVGSKKDLSENIDPDDLLLSDPPPNMGIYNRNGQRLTTSLGLEKIYSEEKNTFVLKTRSDHFFSHIDSAIKKFKNEIDKNPVIAFDQKYRMVIPNAGTTFTEVWGKYHVSDHWMFGHIEDVRGYYTLENVDLTKDYQIENYFSPEPEFCTIWMKNKKINESFSDLLSKRFVILDNQELNYNVVKECEIPKCITDWDLWIKNDHGTVTHGLWIINKKKLILNSKYKL